MDAFDPGVVQTQPVLFDNIIYDELGQVGENVRFGGTGVIEQTDAEALIGLARHPNVFLKISAFFPSFSVTSIDSS